ncbi:sensor histidine kinase [Desulfonatronovibrio hydrogenovorans]|uniref:sensor histidine kinase n=1 Tax=Desulfonatronovibrio hydrogenovorans TaxID=53245 RepID=UPI00048ABB96|nr:sensor histidine kinase [Desulfonatronovibrio hydrogenovorans]
MTRKTVIAVSLLVLVSSAIFLMAYRANRELQDMVTTQFNNQQLTLARKIAQDIRSHFEFLETALATYSTHVDTPGIRARSEHHFQILKDWQVLALGVLHQSDPQAPFISSPDLKSLEEIGLTFPWAEFNQYLESDRLHPFFYSRTIRPASGPFEQSFIKVIATHRHPALTAPVHAGQMEHPGARISFFIVDATAVAGRYARGVISGKTGYPWVLDENGYFLYHVESDFQGQDSTTIRQERNPDISYERINTLTTEKLLKGLEGTDWYISGWHWDVIREMKKLLAFSPVSLPLSPARDAEQLFWSVGLAAPESEVYGMIQPIVIRQWAVAGLFSFFVASVLLALYLLSLRWSSVLALKVEEKTRHLLQSQDLLRREKDKVEQGMAELVKTQQKLVQSERFAAIGEAAAHLSHEIKNPLILMSGFAAQVMRTLPQDDPNREKLRIISDEAKRLEKMLNQVRDFTRPQQLKKKTGDINQLIRETVRLVSTELDSLKIECRLNLSPDVPPMDFDQHQMKQVFLNLLKNAWEAMPGGGWITITTSVERSRVLVCIEDTGVGISKDKLKKIFSPFFTTKDKGTGLGLAVIYRIIHDHNGDIRVDSRLNTGSTFTLYLPVSTDKMRSTPA